MSKPVQESLFGIGLGRELQREAKTRMASRNQAWLDEARATMVLVVREKGFCSSDDCWERCPPPKEAHPSLMGCLFDSPLFVRTGDMHSKRPQARARRISTYELKEEMP
jgi:hypothetical protein